MIALSHIKQSLKVLLCLAVVNLTVPAGAMGMYAIERDRQEAMKPKVKPLPPHREFQTRPLSAHQMRQFQGRWAKNPYVAGANKFSVSYKGVDLMTGNFTTSGTDLTFEGGYGIPVNVTRSYSANQSDEGPLGIGWTLSVDVRSTAGGILKSSGAPVYSVPVAFQERNSAQLNDPDSVDSNGTALQPTEAVIATDAGGKEETEQRDFDGVISTPPWDKNTNNAEYETVSFGGNDYQILVANDTTTPDGTVYHYTKQGTYGSGLVAMDGSGSSEPSNVLKIATVTDRQGNVTTYNYKTGTGSANQATFAKNDGTATEQKLDYILMPNGHQINFTWGNGTNAPTNRIRTADDNLSTAGRTVTYGYDGSGNLTSVTSPAGLVTSYGYSESGYVNAGGSSSYAVTGIGSVLTSITDPRGLTTHIGYTEEDVKIFPYNVTQNATKAYKVIQPNGVTTYYATTGLANKQPTDSYFYNSGGGGITLNSYVDIASGSSTPFQGGNLEATVVTGSGTPVFEIGMGGIGGGSAPVINGAENWRKQYDSRTQDLVWEAHYSSPLTSTLLTNRAMAASPVYNCVETASTFNFMGNPLTTTTTDSSKTTFSGSYTATRVFTTDYAYWGGEKYFLQKASRIRTGSTTYRYDYTDYFDSSASPGYKGLTRYVYSPAFTSFYLDTSITPPVGTSSSDYWKYQLKPSDPTTYSATFDYDTKGRTVDAWKLQKTTTTPWTYAQFHTSYGSDGTPYWGQAYQVIEDYGSGHVNRTTTTNGYTSWGASNDVTDAAGHRFYTTFDADGRVQSITRIDSSLNQVIVSYVYGTSGLTNGAVTEMTDGLSGVVENYTYQSSGGGKGQIASINETNGSDNYSTSYTYSGPGDRLTATYNTSNGTTKWGYGDYVPVGDPSGPSRTFQTLAKLDSSDNPTSEEFHYAYDGAGKILIAAFGQTPQSGFTPTTGSSYYDASHPAASRARAYYVYNADDQITQVNYWWDTWNSGGGSYGTPDALLSNTCAFEVTTGTSNYNRGLKTVSDFYIQNPSNHTSFTLDHEEQFGYDNNRDFLVSASYDGGSTTTTWSYDAAGNRSDASVVDNLNRATTISGVSRTYDISGNTTGIGSSATLTWDVLNRLSSHTVGGTTTSYAYRADGMRVGKTVNSSNYERFYYDGSMNIETTSVNGSSVSISKNAIGARGIDRIERTDSSGTTTTYPMYDAHGNMIATLSKSGAGYSVGNLRSYDAWGQVRAGNTTGEPKSRYCANLGHVQDDESGLIYMRARYYEPASGRFISEDPSRDGGNWYLYCSNSPVDSVDKTGNTPDLLAKIAIEISCGIWGLSLILSGTYQLYMSEDGGSALAAADKIRKGIIFLSISYAAACTSNWRTSYLAAYIPAVWLDRWLTAAVVGVQNGSKTMAGVCVVAYFVYSTMLAAEIISLTIDDLSNLSGSEGSS